MEPYENSLSELEGLGVDLEAKYEGIRVLVGRLGPSENWRESGIAVVVMEPRLGADICIVKAYSDGKVELCYLNECSEAFTVTVNLVRNYMVAYIKQRIT